MDGDRLTRFKIAQDRDTALERALAELRRGRKVSHWMWFVFPQLEGLGSSPTARHYAIESLAEARRYLADDELRRRLLACTSVLLELDASAVEVFGPLDATKLRSSMTLFRLADPGEAAFQAVLDHFFDGQLDPATTKLLGADPDA